MYEENINLQFNGVVYCILFVLFYEYTEMYYTCNCGRTITSWWVKVMNIGTQVILTFTKGDNEIISYSLCSTKHY